jgi:hypothetical protein
MASFVLSLDYLSTVLLLLVKSTSSPLKTFLHRLNRKHLIEQLGSFIVAQWLFVAMRRMCLYSRWLVMGVGGFATPLTICYLGSDVALRSRFNYHNILLTDFLRVCPNKSGLAKAVSLLQSEFVQHVLVAENDRHVPVSTYRAIWTKVATTQLAYLHQAGICVLYSHNKGKRLDVELCSLINCNA